MGPNVFFIFTSCCYLCLTVSVKAIVRIDSPLCDQPDTFHCNDTKKECIPMSLVCNGISECSTGRDESVEECGCNKWEYQCNDSVCIDLIRRCDNVKDCDDGNDEQSCELYQCPSTHSKCKNHMCIPRDKSCDFIDDCGDNSDEETCDYPECYDTQFKCNNSQCISKGMLCDKVPDCLDGSDEANCDSYFQCSDHLRLVNSTVCDGWVDCDGDQKDEINCGECSKSEFSCNNGRCIKLSNVCDGVCDCGGTCDDEDECGSVDCPVGEGYICRNEVNKQLRCIDKKYLCDGNNDCLNTNVGADEYFCWNISQECADFPRHYKKFVCPEGRCLPASGPENVVCDHWYDCLNGEDEQNCDYATCSPLEDRCGNGQCIKENQRCNGVFDCADRTDETNCENWKCPTGHYKCRGGQCIPGHHRCDYYRDCPDGTDEKNCENHENRRKCLPNEFKCDNGQCIDRGMICYKGKNVGRRGCADGSHMHNCSGWNCTVGQYKCRMSYCIDMEQLCDSLVDCSNTYEDELGCPYVCPYKANTCMCEESKLNCTRRALTDLPDYLEYESGLTDFILTGNFLNVSLTSDTFRTYDRLVHLDLSNNSIVTLPSGSFHSLWRLTSLSLEKNKIKVLKNGTFIGLMNLRSLYLAHNAIEKIEAFAFTGLSKLQTLDLSFHNLRILQRSTFVGLRNLFTLDLSHNQIRYIADGSFNGLPVLLTLDLSENQIEIIEPNTFHGLQTLRTLYTDEFHFCCLIDSVAKCYPEPDEFSSCEDLMSNYFLRASIWILGIIAFFGNILVFAWRVRDFRKGKVHSFLISNLAIADFFMGVYLLIIASVDSYYRGNYFIYDKLWKESSFCKFAGCISTFSSELSVFTLTVITFDRLICIIFPLKLKRLGIKQACIVMPLVWIVVLGISTIPLLEMSYFSNFYGRSGVCLALHITPEKPKGWEYSVFVFLVLNFVSFLLIFLSYLWMFLVAKKTTTAVRKSKAKSDKSMAKRMTLIVMTDFCCWIPIILLGFISLGGFSVPQQVYAWVAVFVLPLNSAINPVLYTISTAPFMRNIRKRASRFRKSFTGSFRSSFTKHSYIDERTSETWNRHSMYRQLELMRLRGLKKTYSYSTHRTPEKLSRM